MRLLAPLGLLGLIGVAVLIVIYILKPNSKERVVSNIYVWELSLKYRKKRSPLDWLRNNLLLILQILAICIIAFMLSQPALVTARDIKEKVIILDSSASMLAQSGEKTRFEIAKEEIMALVEETVPDGKISIISASDFSRIEVSRDSRADYIRQVVASLECTYSALDADGAIELSEDILENCPSAEVIFITDGEYADSGTVKVINVANEEKNVAILDFKSEVSSGYHVFSAQISSYGEDKDVVATLYINGERADSTIAKCRDAKPVTVSFDSEKTRITDDKFEWAKLTVDVQDSLVYDNEFSIYNMRQEKFKIQYVSDSPEFMNFHLLGYENANVTVLTPENADKIQYSGFDLYIFENYTPLNRPSDGSVWVINPGAALPSDFHFAVENEVSLGELTPLSSKTSGSQMYRGVMNSIDAGEIGVTKYKRALEYEGYEKLMYCENNPVFFASETGGLKTYILTFDMVHFSDMILLPQYTLLIQNILNYTFHSFIEETLFEVNEDIAVYPQAGGAGNVTFSDGETVVDEKSNAPSVFQAKKPGTYYLEQKRNDTALLQPVYVRLAKSESDFSVINESLKNPNVAADDGAEQTVVDEFFELLRYIAVGLLVLLVIEWGLQYRGL